MPKPSSNAPRPAPIFARNRWISPRQAEMLESLWNARLRRAGRRLRPERSREERFRHIAETVGRSVENARELSWREANRVLRRLLDEVRSLGPSSAPADPSAATSETNAPARPGRSARKRDPKAALLPPARAKNNRRGRSVTQRNSHSKDKKLHSASRERRTG
jgi:hypothetical protein